MNKSRMGEYRRWRLRVSVHESAGGDFRSTVELWAPGQEPGIRSPLRLDGGSRPTAGDAESCAVQKAQEWIDGQPDD